jgi:type I restriction enzyme S subunit
MAGEFRETTLGHLLAYANGRASPERAEGLPYPIYGSNGIIGYTSDTNADQGTIVIGRVGTYCGSLYLSKQKCWVTDNAIRATALGENDPRFLYYLLGTLGLNLWRAGSGQPLVNQDILSRIPTIVPAPAEQRAIGRILGALDDKIELNQRVNETLEAMARALFKSWFVDFDPVCAKAEGRDTSLPKPIADLFPAHLVDSELGEIPEGWPVSDLVSVSSYLNRGLSPSYIEREGVLVLNQKSVRDRRVDLNKGRRHDPSARSVAGRLLKKGDVLVNSTGVGTLGRVGQLLTVEEDTIVDSHVTVIRADERRLSWNYLGINLWSREEEIEALGEGSTGQTELSRTRLGNLPVLVPPRNIIGAFDSVSLPVRERCALNEQQSYVLAAVRDALVPKLISGELRVKDIGFLFEDGS